MELAAPAPRTAHARRAARWERPGRPGSQRAGSAQARRPPPAGPFAWRGEGAAAEGRGSGPGPPPNRAAARPARGRQWHCPEARPRSRGSPGQRQRRLRRRRDRGEHALGACCRVAKNSASDILPAIKERGGFPSGAERRAGCAAGAACQLTGPASGSRPAAGEARLVTGIAGAASRVLK